MRLKWWQSFAWLLELHLNHQAGLRTHRDVTLSRWLASFPFIEQWITASFFLFTVAGAAPGFIWQKLRYSTGFPFHSLYLVQGTPEARAQ